MSAAAATIVPQLSHGESCVKTCGTGSAHSRPTTLSTITGTQIQCSSLFVGWLCDSAYSSNQVLTLRIATLVGCAETCKSYAAIGCSARRKRDPRRVLE